MNDVKIKIQEYNAAEGRKLQPGPAGQTHHSKYTRFLHTTVAQFILQQLCTYKRVRHNVSVTLQPLAARSPSLPLSLSPSRRDSSVIDSRGVR